MEYILLFDQQFRKCHTCLFPLGASDGTSECTHSKRARLSYPPTDIRCRLKTGSCLIGAVTGNALSAVA